MTTIIHKIIDNRQYAYSHAFSRINLEDVVKSYEKIYVSNDNMFDPVFGAVDRCESDLSILDNNFYIVPVFYNHAEQTETLQDWKTHVYAFINDNVELLSKSNVVLAIYDLFETSRHFIDSVTKIANSFSFNILAVTANKKFKSNMSNLTVLYNDSWIKQFPARKQIIEYKSNKLYINFNRVARKILEYFLE